MRASETIPDCNGPISILQKQCFSLRTTRPGSGSGLGERADGQRSGKMGEMGSKNAVPDGIFFKARSDRSLRKPKTGHFLKYLGKDGRTARGMGIAGRGGE